MKGKKSLVYDSKLHRYRSTWEIVWHPGRERYYYRDSVTGESSWLKPEGPDGCDTDVPREKPKHPTADLHTTENMPDGWSKVYDQQSRKFFYVNKDEGKRTWFVPMDSMFRPNHVFDDESEQGYSKQVEDRVARPNVGEDSTLSDLWKPEEFLLKYDAVMGTSMAKNSSHQFHEDVSFHVTGGKDPGVDAIRGTYHFFGEVNGKPCYKKVGHPVMVYYYDDRDHDAFNMKGWWIATEKHVGRAYEWSYHAYQPDTTATFPPCADWYFPNQEDARVYQNYYKEAHIDATFHIASERNVSRKEAHHGEHIEIKKKQKEMLRELYREVMVSNEDHINVKSLHDRLPVTVPVTFKECMEALQSRAVCSYRVTSSISMSNRTTADAIYSYASDPKRTVCALNFASGTKRLLSALTKEHAKQDASSDTPIALIFCDNPHDQIQVRRSLSIFVRAWRRYAALSARSNATIRKASHVSSENPPMGSTKQAEKQKLIEQAKDNDTQEADLCRRIALLHRSLNESRGIEDTDLYPFGPPTCFDIDVPNKYCDVLFTPCTGINPETKRPTSLFMTRGSEEDGYPILPESRFCKVCIVSAVAPCLHLKVEEVEDVSEETFLVHGASLKSVNGIYFRTHHRKTQREEWAMKVENRTCTIRWSLEFQDWVLEDTSGVPVYRCNYESSKVPTMGDWVALDAPHATVRQEYPTKNYVVSGAARARTNGLYVYRKLEDGNEIWTREAVKRSLADKIVWSAAFQAWVIVNSNGEVLYKCNDSDIPSDSQWSPEPGTFQILTLLDTIEVSGGVHERANGRYVISKDIRHNKEAWIKMGSTTDGSVEYRIQWSKYHEAWMIEHVHGESFYQCRSDEHTVPRDGKWEARDGKSPTPSVIFKECIDLRSVDRVVGHNHIDADGIYLRCKEPTDNKESWIHESGGHRIQWSSQIHDWVVVDAQGKAIYQHVCRIPKDRRWTAVAIDQASIGDLPRRLVSNNSQVAQRRNAIVQFQDGKVEERPADIWDFKLLYQLMTTIFVAPILKEPRCTTLILGAWGCGARHDCEPRDIAQLFAQCILREFSALDLCLGRLYHEIHFAIPCDEISTKDQGSNYGVFKRVFEENGIEVKEYIVPDSTLMTI